MLILKLIQLLSYLLDNFLFMFDFALVKELIFFILVVVFV